MGFLFMRFCPWSFVRGNFYPLRVLSTNGFVRGLFSWRICRGVLSTEVLSSRGFVHWGILCLGILVQGVFNTGSFVHQGCCPLGFLFSDGFVHWWFCSLEVSFTGGLFHW